MTYISPTIIQTSEHWTLIIPIFPAKCGKIHGPNYLATKISVRFGKNFAELMPNFLAFNIILTYNIRVKSGQIMQFSATNRFLSHITMPQYISRQLRFTF